MTANFRNVILLAGVTMLVMFASNFVAAQSPQARRILKGQFLAVA